MMKLRVIMACLVISTVSVGLALAAETAGIWIDVPFVTQSKDGCGSAAMSMVLQYWAKKTGQPPSTVAGPERIQAALFVPAEKGIPASAMQKYFQDFGYRTFAFRGEWEDLRHHLSAGRPLIVSLKPNGWHGPLHYVVVVGIDWDRDYVFLNDPAQQKTLRVSREGFESQWNAAGNWTLLALPWPGD